MVVVVECVRAGAGVREGRQSYPLFRGSTVRGEHAP